MGGGKNVPDRARGDAQLTRVKNIFERVIDARTPYHPPLLLFGRHARTNLIMEPNERAEGHGVQSGRRFFF